MFKGSRVDYSHYLRRPTYSVRRYSRVLFGHNQDFDNTVWLDGVAWTGTPPAHSQRGGGRSGILLHTVIRQRRRFLLRVWQVLVAQGHGEGIVTYGTREFKDHKVVFKGFTVNLGAPSGVAIRVRGLNRHYGLLFVRNDRVTLIKVHDEQRSELASTRFSWKFDVNYLITMEVEGNHIYVCVGDMDTELPVNDSEFLGGGVGLMATGGSISADAMELGPLEQRRSIRYFDHGRCRHGRCCRRSRRTVNGKHVVAGGSRTPFRG